MEIKFSISAVSAVRGSGRRGRVFGYMVRTKKLFPNSWLWWWREDLQQRYGLFDHNGTTSRNCSCDRRQNKISHDLQYKRMIIWILLFFVIVIIVLAMQKAGVGYGRNNSYWHYDTTPRSARVDVGVYIWLFWSRKIRTSWCKRIWRKN
jgi:hypothetical protein